MGSESHHQKLLVEASGGSICYTNQDKGIFPEFSPRISALTHICTRACVKFRLVVRENFGVAKVSKCVGAARLYDPLKCKK